MRQLAIIAAVLLLAAVPAPAEPYEFSYYPVVEAPGGQGGVIEQFPEEQGWTHFQNGNVSRWIDTELEALVLSAAQTITWDFYTNDSFGAINPVPGELLFVEWTMRVESESGGGDTTVTVGLDEFLGDITIQIAMGAVYDFEGFETYAFSPGVFHTFVVLSENLVNYELYVDGEKAFADVFKTPSGLASLVGWGDTTTKASTSSWLSFRYGASRLGDVDLDGAIDLNDFAIFATCFGAMATEPPMGCADVEFGLSDLDGNGEVNLLDFATFAVNFGT